MKIASRALRHPTMSRSLILRFVIAGMVPLLAAAGLLFIQERSSARTQARDTAGNQADALASDLTREFQQWQTELLVAANNPALRAWFANPSERNSLQTEVNRLLLQLNTLSPDLIDEACFISAAGPELGRQVKGVAAPASDLSPDESDNPFFQKTLVLAEGQVHRNAPYVSPDSNQWVISNSTPIFVAGQKVALLHFESNLDSIRLRMQNALRSGIVLRVVDTATSTTIVDSRNRDRIITQPFLKTNANPMPTGWQNAGVDLQASPNDDNHWRVEVSAAPAAAFSGGLLLRLSALVLLACFGLVILARLSTKAIVAPLRALATVAEALADGDRDQRVAIVGFEEIVHVGTAFNTMVAGLKDQDLQLVAAEAEREQHLSATVEQQRRAEQNLRERAQSAIDGTTESLSQEIRRLNEHVEKVRQGAQMLDQRVTSTDEITRSVAEQARVAERVVGQLQTSLGEVDAMTKLIAGVADQTKLLALNATIEAARAGESGRGFSVVADEVKELAMTTAHSTDQITATIATLNAHSSAVAEAITEMSGGITNVGEAAGGLRLIAEQQFSVVIALNAQVDETLDRIESMSSVTTTLERRKGRRAPVKGVIELRVGGGLRSGTLVDISDNGLRCSAPIDGLQVGQQFSATFALDGQKLSVTGTIAFCRNAIAGGELGLALSSPSSVVAEGIRRYLTR